MFGPISAVLLTEQQAAELTGFTPRTMKNWRRVGGGPAFVRVGRSVRYRPADLESWATKRLRASTSDPGTGAD